MQSFYFYLFYDKDIYFIFILKKFGIYHYYNDTAYLHL